MDSPPRIVIDISKSGETGDVTALMTSTHGADPSLVRELASHTGEYLAGTGDKVVFDISVEQ